MKHFEDLWEENGGGICGKRACEGYYRAALDWVKKEAISLDERGDTSRNVINKELES